MNEYKYRDITYTVARGLFNIREVPWTHVCIPIRGSLVKLIVPSKHSLGAPDDSEKSHAVVAERWLEKHLKEKGKSWQRHSGMIILPLSLK